MEAEFRHLAGFDLPEWVPNLPEHRQPFLNPVFAQLAVWGFDYPERLPAMRAWAREQAERQPEPRTWELVGYFEYLLEDWGGAARSFMRSLEAEPRNLDAWFSLAFALKHLGLEIGESILFDHDVWMRLRSERTEPLTLSGLYRMHAEVEASGDCYRHTWPRDAQPYLSGP